MGQASSIRVLLLSQVGASTMYDADIPYLKEVSLPDAFRWVRHKSISSRVSCLLLIRRYFSTVSYTW